jgi:hypothetical protein
MPNRVRVIAIAVLAFALVGFSKDFTPPPAQTAASYSLHETHTNEHLTIAVDPYNTPHKLEGAKVPYLEHELLPLRFIITNDGDTPVALTQMDIELITAAKDKIPPAALSDIERRIARPDKNPDRTTRSTPWPIPRVGKPTRVKQDQQDEIDNLLFRAKAIGPHATVSGFLFFDVQGLSDPLHRARLYVTGMMDGGGKELLYFEIPLDSASGNP